MNLSQLPELPKNPMPIVIIGAGGIIKETHKSSEQGGIEL